MFLFMLVFIPISLVLAFLIKAPPLWVFLTSILAIVPLAVWIRRGTEQIAFRTGPSIGGLLNVSFGNAAELILALFVLSAGKGDVVKGQITGSIIGNSLLGLGLATVVGTWGKRNLKFNRDQAGLLSTLLMLVLIGLLLPAIFDFTERDIVNAPNAFTLDEQLSLAVSVVLILLYIGNLIYTLVTHNDIFSAEHEEQGNDSGNEKEERWPLWKSLLILSVATAATALEAELVSGALDATASSIGVTTFYLGVIVLAVIGNAAEFVSAVYFARQGNMDLVVSITVGSTVQVALFVAPLLVLVSYLFGNPMDLVFNNPIELIAIASVAFAVNAIAKDGEVTWFEGVLLLGVYLLMAIAFFLVTPT
jgi:Ca2+:H+ antiporter